MNQLLSNYKHLIDFEDNMQKSNYKFVENYLKFQSRKNRVGWEQDCIEFLNGAINLQKDLLQNIRSRMVMFN